MKKPTTRAVGETAIAPALSAELKAKVLEWNSIREWLVKGAAQEMALRKELALHFVPKPVEGTNNVQGLGFAVKVVHKISRKLDEAALDAVMPQLPEQLRLIGNLISYRPAFSTEVYRTLTTEERKIFDQALTIKEDGSPTLEIILADDGPTVTAEKIIKREVAKAKAAKPAKQNKPAAKPAKGKRK